MLYFVLYMVFRGDFSVGEGVIVFNLKSNKKNYL